MNISYDGLATFFIFLIGVPALVIENQKSELRRIVLQPARRRTLFVRAGQWIALTLAIMFVGVATDALHYADCANMLLAPHAICWFFHGVPEDLIWLCVFAALVGISILATIRFLHRYGGYRGILEDLHREIIKPIRDHPENVPYLQPESLEDLVELGRQSDPGQDKQQVLGELFELVRVVCTQPKYRGDSLERLILGLVQVVGADPKVGSSQNFETASKIMEYVLTCERQCAETHRDDDARYAIHVTGRLGQRAARHLKAQIEIVATLNVYLETLDLAADTYPQTQSHVSGALLELGSTALEEGHILAAMGALNKLIVLYENPAEPPQKELTTDTLGLVAHFWDAGETARSYVARRLDEIQVRLTQPLAAELHQAQHHCARTSRFKTADCLGKMIREYSASAVAEAPM